MTRGGARSKGASSDSGKDDVTGCLISQTPASKPSSPKEAGWPSPFATRPEKRFPCGEVAKRTAESSPMRHPEVSGSV